MPRTSKKTAIGNEFVLSMRAMKIKIQIQGHYAGFLGSLVKSIKSWKESPVKSNLNLHVHYLLLLYCFELNVICSQDACV